MSIDPLRPHRHDNNVTPPTDDPTITLIHPDGSAQTLDLHALSNLPQSSLHYSFHTDHGAHGPYHLHGVALRDLVDARTVREIEVISADGYGNRILVDELRDGNRPILLCTHSDGQPLSRQNGLVRLVVPSETDNALRQIKWVATIRLVS